MFPDWQDVLMSRRCTFFLKKITVVKGYLIHCPLKDVIDLVQWFSCLVRELFNTSCGRQNSKMAPDFLLSYPQFTHPT